MICERSDEETEVKLGDKPTPLEFMQAVYLNPELPVGTRLRAAIAALPFVHPRLSVIANISNASLGDRLERAIARSAQSPGFRLPQIEAKAQIVDGEEPTAEAVFKRRF